MRITRRGLCSLAFILALSISALAQAKLTSPKEHFGFNIGDDYHLANYTQYEAYLKKLDAESDRLKVVEMGKSAEGRTMYLAIITSPENHKNLNKYRDISKRLTLAEGLSDTDAKQLAKDGKAIVWIDGGLHANEVLGAQQLIETIWMLTSGTDEETLRFLNDDIALGCLVNPDGMELVSNWYMRESDPLKRSTVGLPRLYQKYIGHDNNRDFYLSAQPESEAINRIFYHEWFPQIVYNHHQTGPVGTVMFAPPFRDPFNYTYDPLIPLGVDLVGAAMHSRFAAEGKPGVTMRTGASYSTWWNGGLRTTVYFHNMIGLLTETIGNPTPMEIPLVIGKQLPKADLPFPIAPQKWHFRQSIEYSLTANRAVLDVAARYRDTLLYRAYQMGKNSIERGSRDNWTFTPHEIADTEAAAARERAGDQGADGPRPERAIGFQRPANKKYYDAMRTPEKRDPRGFIIAADQPDFLTAIKFANALIKTGVTIHRASAAFSIGSKNYPAGSLVVKASQAFRPHVLDMFEPQDHPNDFAYPGGPPLPPYDSAGWTLAYQMGIKFDRVLEAFDGPFEKVTGMIKPTPGKITSAATAVGFYTSHEVNDSFIATAKLLGSGEEVYWLKQAQGNRPAGTLYIPAKAGTQAKLQGLATELGLNFEATTTKPSGELFKLKQPRIGLFDRYGGSMPSGWTRWLLEQFQIPFTVVYPQTLDAGDLASKFDVLIFVTGSIPGQGGGGGGRGGGGGGGGFGGGDVEPGGGGPGGRADSIPEEFRGWLGSITANKTVPQLKAFVEAGGALLAIGTSTSMGYHAGLPLANALMEKSPDGSERPLSREKFYVPGSLLQASVDNTNPLAYGLPAKLDIYFDNSPVFRLKPEAALQGVKPVAWFPSDKPLRSGWAWGQKYLQDGVAVVEAPVGKGRLFLFGPEIAFRAQPHGTFKFLFNGIYYGKAETVKW
jgi:hypothetical protein